MSIHIETEKVGSTKQLLHFDTGNVWPIESQEGEPKNPGAHELFDASLVACKALTAHWYAKQRNFPLERVSVEVTRDNSHEQDKENPWYGLTLKFKFEGPLTEEQRKRLYDVLERCPIHKLMTSTEVRITALPLE
jgi:putative redox protein